MIYVWIAGVYLMFALAWLFVLKQKAVHLTLSRRGVSGEWTGPFDDPHGFKITLSFGEWMRPWSGYRRVDKFPWFTPKRNPWFDPDCWRIRSFIPLPGLFISYRTKSNKGAYLGFKIFDVDADEPWALQRDIGKVMLCPSVSIRKTADR